MGGLISATDTLRRLGFDERLEAALSTAPEGAIPGRVARLDRGGGIVLTDDGPIPAELSVALLRAVAGAEDLPAVGDWVALSHPEDADTALIEAVLPRKSAFIRSDPGEATDAQVLAANIDTVFIVHALAGPPNLRRIERELVLAWESGAMPVVLLHKADLSPGAEEARGAVEAVAPGVPVHLTSAVDRTGIDELRSYLEGDRTVALFGPSGVGKSTLVNLLVGEDVQDVEEVRASDQKGRHTTVARELVQLPGGGILVDTPGLRALALWDADEGIAQAFPDIQSFAGGCRFRDCTHDTEPGCAVTQAVEDGELPVRRLESYRALQQELDYLAQRKDVRARKEKGKRFASYRKTLRDHPKYRDRPKGR